MTRPGVAPQTNAAAVRNAAALVRLSILLVLCAFGLIASAPQADAQSTGTISGTVRDVTGALVPGATVTLISVNSKAHRATVSNAEGYFTLNAIQPTTYNLVVTMAGFESYKITGIEIHPGDSATIATIAMKVGTVTQEIDVSATTAGVNINSPEKSALITAEDIQRLSTVGRDASELIKILPGFAISTGGGLDNSNTSANSQTMGFGSSSVSSFSANGATPQTGATTVISDGANVMDPGDMGASIANVNMDMVQEIKVQTSNFGADSAKGPVVINAVGKSGGSSFHGAAYLYARNGALNSNDWLNNYDQTSNPSTHYYFPGANVGGPILIPGTNFNHAKKLTFFTAFEYYDQTVYQGQTLQSFIPTPRMLSGDLTPASLAAALNVSQQTLTADCPNFYTSNGVPLNTLSNSGGICYSPGESGTTYTQQDQLIVAGSVVNGANGGLLPVDPRANIYAKFWPSPNRTPRAGNGLASDGYNYINAVTSTNNGYQYRARIDENFTDNTKLYVTYNLEYINSEIPVDNTYYYGADGIPYPNPLYTHTKSNSVSLNFTHVFSPTLTNELVSSGVYYNSPNQLQNRAQVQDAATGWSGGRYYNNGALQLPGLVDYEEGTPDFAMGYIPANSAFLRKISFNGGDNLTKQYRTHSIKAGVYGELTGNNQVPYNYTQGLNAFNHYNSGCITNDGLHTSQLQNNVANFLQGCSGFSQASSSLNSDMHFRTVGFYVTDEWKTTKKLTLTMGIRFDHLGPWYDVHGVGLAVWTPPMQHVIYSGVTQDPHTFPGISWHQKDSSIPISGSPSTTLFYSPRAGLAYDLYGNGKTVFRGGWGAYRFHDNYNDAAGPLSTAEGIQSYTTPSNLSCTYGQLSATSAGNTTPGTACYSSATNAISPFSIYALNPKDTQQPVTYNYNLTVDQVIPFGTNLEISYVGNRSQHTFTEGNLNNQNYIPLGALFQPDPLTGQVSYPGTTQQVQQDYRPYPNYTAVYVPNHVGYGNYNALQVSVNRQRGAFIYGFNYTWAKALGIRGDYRTGAVGDPSTLRNNYGYLGFNRSSAANFTYSWQVGNMYHGKRLVAAIVNQWEIAGITNIQSGPDVAVLNGTSNTNFGLSGGVAYTPPGTTTSIPVNLSNTTVLGTPDINLQPVLTCNPKSQLQNNVYGRQYVNGNCFALPTLGTNGAFELPDIHGPMYFSSDLTVKRSFKLKAKQALQFSLSGTNFLNHPLPAFYGGNGANLSLGFGTPTGYVATTPQQAIAAATQTTKNFGYTPYKRGFRIIEVGARYTF